MAPLCECLVSALKLCKLPLHVPLVTVAESGLRMDVYKDLRVCLHLIGFPPFTSGKQFVLVYNLYGSTRT